MLMYLCMDNAKTLCSKENKDEGRIKRQTNLTKKYKFEDSHSFDIYLFVVQFGYCKNKCGLRLPYF